MTEDRVFIKMNATVLAMDGKTIRFHLPVAHTRLNAHGNGKLNATETEQDGMIDVSISVWESPETESGIGGVRIKLFYLNHDEVDLIRPSSDPAFQIECIDPSIPPP